jgi:hypothetical protein
MGAWALGVFVIVTAVRGDAAHDRDDLLEVLVTNGVEPIVARKICDEGESLWARWRIKTRPLLWRLGRDWPEYSQTLKEEFEAYYERGLPEAQSSLDQLKAQSGTASGQVYQPEEVAALDNLEQSMLDQSSTPSSQSLDSGAAPDYSLMESESNESELLPIPDSDESLSSESAS